MSERDYLGDEMPEGYEPWMCPVCTAVCNFGAMMQCAHTADCGFDLEQPESNGGAFGFIMKRLVGAAVGAGETENANQ